MRKQIAGISLIEIWLVIIIAMGIVYYGFRQYLDYRRQSDIYQVQYNVDLLFNAMGQYFRANCANRSGPLGTTDPTVPIPMSSLISGGYITNKLALSPILNYSTPSQGYVLQFNQVVPSPNRKIDLSPVNGTPPTPPTVNVGKIILWKAQVAVLLKDTATAPQFSRLLLADCLSSQAGQIVTPCTGAPGTGNAAVFERLPSFAISAYNSDLWVSNPLVKQFTQMYTTDPILVLTDGSSTSTQFYVCTN